MKREEFPYLVGVIAGLLLFAAVAGCWFTGIWLAFCAAIWLGVVLIFVPPLALICGMAYWLGSVDLAAKFIQWIS